MKIDTDSFRVLPKAFKADRQIVLQIVKDWPEGIYDAADSLKSDTEIILTIITPSTFRMHCNLLCGAYGSFEEAMEWANPQVQLLKQHLIMKATMFKSREPRAVVPQAVSRRLGADRAFMLRAVACNA